MFNEITKNNWLLFAQQNYDNPTVNRMVTDVNSDNSWLFNSARGNLGVPKGQVVM